MIDKYRIVCNIDDTWVVQERMGDGSWMSVHHCELKAVQTSIGIVPPMPDDDPTADLPF